MSFLIFSLNNKEVIALLDILFTYQPFNCPIPYPEHYKKIAKFFEINIT